MLAGGLRDTEGIRAVPRLLIMPRQLPYTQGRRQQIQVMEKKSPPPRTGGRAKTKTLATYSGPGSRPPLRTFGPPLSSAVLITEENH
jgi:hypothetical protein